MLVGFGVQRYFGRGGEDEACLLRGVRSWLHGREIGIVHRTLGGRHL